MIIIFLFFILNIIFKNIFIINIKIINHANIINIRVGKINQDKNHQR